jgi:diguanylate cyclase (GGDEF)-like protein/PAS domain S-box-containing protein
MTMNGRRMSKSRAPMSLPGIDARGVAWLLVSVLAWLLAGVCHVATAADARVVRVGVYQNPPKIFLKGGRISGIFGDILDQLARREGWRIVPVACDWNQCLNAVRDGSIDLMPDVAATVDRVRTMDFGTVPALFSWSEIYRRPAQRIDTVRDLAGKRLAVLAGSVQESYLKQLLQNFGIRDVAFIAVDSLRQAFELTAAGRADCVAANNFFGDAAALRYGLRSTPVIFDPARLYFVAPRGSGHALLPRIDADLAAWQSDPGSVYYTILTQWRVDTRQARIPMQLWWGLGALAALLLSALMATAWLRREVRRRTRELKASEGKLSVILDEVGAYIYIKGLDLRYQYVNQKVAERLGRRAADMLGLRDQDLFDARTAEQIRMVDERVLRDGARITIEEQTPDPPQGSLRTLLSVKQPLRDQEGRIYALCGISTDITDIKRSEERIRHLAFYDALTHLPNRTLLLERIQHAFDSYARTRSDAALLFVDLDNFKLLNDTLGHAKGDQLLQRVAERLSRHLRQGDTLARLGGDEFVLLAENLGHDLDAVTVAIKTIAEKLRRELVGEPVALDGVSYTISASIGVALLSLARHGGDDTPGDDLLKRADLAMYEAKSAGRNQVKCFDPSMQASLNRRAELEAQLKDGLRFGQFQLAYQAIVDEAGRVVGAEALARWPHPDKGAIAPSTFIAAAETSGQIIALGEWILHSACAQLAAWGDSAAHRGLTLSVNVSARQVHHPDFVAQVTGALEQARADPARLELELTESVFAHDLEGVAEKMRSLQALGVRFSLDDFGTGYSSLSYLKRLPLHQLKIDQSFVRELLDDAHDAAIVRAVLTLGDSLGLEVVAEGVETAAHCQTLRRLGCRRFQGYLFGRPGAAENVLDALPPA